MTDYQIETYNYCRKYLERLKGWEDNFAIDSQQFSCSQSSPNIESQLQSIHSDMMKDFDYAFNRAISNVKNIITEL